VLQGDLDVLVNPASRIPLLFMQSRVPLGPGKFHVVVLVMLRIDTCSLKDRGRIHELETQEISQKALSDALTCEWVDNLIANMPTNGTRGHIR